MTVLSAPILTNFAETTAIKIGCETSFGLAVSRAPLLSIFSITWIKRLPIKWMLTGGNKHMSLKVCPTLQF